MSNRNQQDHKPENPKERIKSQEPGAKESEVGSPKSDDSPSADRPAPTELKKSEIKNPTSEINMEVHHHPQLEHKPKPWKEYLLEGLMIFLAVFMGFIAETIREGISDRSKGKEYIRSFVEDLRADTANFSSLIKFDTKKVTVLSSMSPCFDTIQNGRNPGACLVPLVRASSYNRGESFADGTLQQLKNAGGFRLLNKADKDSIVEYDHAARAYLNFESTIFQERQDIVRSMYVKLLNYQSQAAMFPDTGKGVVKTPVLFSTDKALLNKFFNDLFIYRKVNRQQAISIGKLKDRAIRLIKYFDNKYGLE